jgi:hypothetical protein
MYHKYNQEIISSLTMILGANNQSTRMQATVAIYYMGCHISLPVPIMQSSGNGSNNLDADFGSWTQDFASLDCTTWIQHRL